MDDQLGAVVDCDERPRVGGLGGAPRTSGRTALVADGGDRRRGRRAGAVGHPPHSGCHRVRPPPRSWAHTRGTRRSPCGIRGPSHGPRRHRHDGHQFTRTCRCRAPWCSSTIRDGRSAGRRGGRADGVSDSLSRRAAWATGRHSPPRRLCPHCARPRRAHPDLRSGSAGSAQCQGCPRPHRRALSDRVRARRGAQTLASRPARRPRTDVRRPRVDRGGGRDIFAPRRRKGRGRGSPPCSGPPCGHAPVARCRLRPATASAGRPWSRRRNRGAIVGTRIRADDRLDAPPSASNFLPRSSRRRCASSRRR